MATKAAPTIAALKKKAQKLANEYARRRDCMNGGANCISCGLWFDYEDLDGGHFMPTTVPGVRFDERNINAQCRKCNRFGHGEQAKYFVGMEKKYGREVIDYLMNPIHKRYIWDRYELEDIIEYYKKKIKEVTYGP